jgi:hypothetical protein
VTETADESAQHLRAAVLALRAPNAVKRAAAPTSSVFGRAAAAVPRDVHPPAPRAHIAGRFRSVETTALLPGTSLALVVVPTPGAPPPALVRTMQLLVDGGATVVLLGPQMPRRVTRGGLLTVPLREDDALHGEEALIACGAARRVAFLARRETGPADLWSWLVTRDAVAVHRAATAILDRLPFLDLRIPPLGC